LNMQYQKSLLVDNHKSKDSVVCCGHTFRCCGFCGIVGYALALIIMTMHVNELEMGNPEKWNQEGHFNGSYAAAAKGIKSFQKSDFFESTVNETLIPNYEAIAFSSPNFTQAANGTLKML